MVKLMKKTPTGTDEIHEELSHFLALHKTDTVYVAVQTKFGEPFILIYTIKTAYDFDGAVDFIQNYRRSGGLVALYTRADSTHRMGKVAEKVLEHEPEHPYKRGLQWLVADAEDCKWYRTDDRLFALSVDFYNLVVRELPDRYQDVFGMAIADMQRKHRRPFTEEVSELHTPDPEDRQPYRYIVSEDGPVRVKNTTKPDSTDPEDDEPEDEPKDTHTVGHGDTEDVMNPDLTASYSQLLMF